MIKSAQRICDSRCVMMKVVRPRAALEMARWILSSVAESMAEVESSKNQDMRIGEKGARECNALTLPAG